MAAAIQETDTFTAFWNDVLVAKFERFRNIMLEGLSYHSAVPLAKLDVPAGTHAVDVGCGWGDTAIELARKVGPTGSVVGLDCCPNMWLLPRSVAMPFVKTFVSV